MSAIKVKEPPLPDGMEAMSNQLIKLKNALGEENIFHEPYPNNYSIVLKNKYHNNELYGKGNLELFFGLNKASLNLQVFCKLCLSEIENEWKSFDSVIFEQLKYINSVWSKLNKGGNSFLTYIPAKALVEGLRALGYPFDEKLEEKIVVKNAFVQLLPYEAKALIRIGLFIDFKDLYELLFKLNKEISKCEELSKYIERIEIAKEDFKAEKPIYSFPKININMNPYLVRSVDHECLDKLIGILDDLMKDIQPLDMYEDYSFKVKENIIMSQGYRNYKQFLDLLNNLDSVYDSSSNYAFMKKSVVN